MIPLKKETDLSEKKFTDISKILRELKRNSSPRRSLKIKTSAKKITEGLTKKNYDKVLPLLSI